MQIRESLSHLTGKFFSRERGQGTAGVIGEEVHRNPNQQFSPTPYPIIPPVETNTEYVSRELTSEEFIRAQNYFKVRCVEIEQYSDFPDAYWQTICPLMQKVTRFLNNGQCRLAIAELNSVIEYARQTASASKIDNQLDEESRKSALKNQRAIIESLEFDLLVLDPTHKRIPN